LHFFQSHFQVPYSRPSFIFSGSALEQPTPYFKILHDIALRIRSQSSWETNS